MVVFKFFVCFTLFVFSSYDSLLDKKDYIKIFRLSVEYEKYKKRIEDLIEGGRVNTLRIKDIREIQSLVDKTENMINDTYSNYSNNHEIRSQLYQIKFEIDEIKNIIAGLTKAITKKDRRFKEMVYKLEYYLFRMNIYLKGMSQKLSML
jgi:hypothetical protein